MLAVIGRIDVRHQILEAQLWHGTDWRPFIDELAGLARDIEYLRELAAGVWRARITEARDP